MAVKKRKSKLQKKETKGIHIPHAIMMLASVCTILSSIVVFIQFVYPVLVEKYKKERWSVTYRRTAGNNEALILIAEFENFGTHKFNISGRIHEILQKELSPFPDVKVYLYPDAVPTGDPAKAAAIGWKYNALMLIWGTYDDAGVRPVFALPRTLPVDWEGVTPSLPDLDCRIARTIRLFDIPMNADSIREAQGRVFEDFSSDSSMSKYINGALPKQMVYLAALTLGVRYVMAGKTEKSLQAFDKCIAFSGPASMNNGLSVAYGYRGRIRLSKSESGDAMSDLNKAVELDSGNVGARLDRASHYFSQNEVALADVDFIAAQKKIQQYPDSCKSEIFEKTDLTLFYRIAGLLNAEFSRPEAAAPFLEKYLQSASQNDPKALAAVYVELGLAYKDQKEFGLSEKTFLKAVSIDSTDARPYYWLGALSYETIRDTAKSCRYFKKYLTLQRDSVAASWAVKKITPICRGL
jgi:tetratricopeptide (TPR) repeat protein